MNCSNCSSNFDNETHIPMMLPFCGHSLCKHCLEEIPENTDFKCLLCGRNYKFKNLNNFPINESLLHIISYIGKDKHRLNIATPTSSKFLQRVPSKSYNTRAQSDD